eukprot:g21820.t1
MALGGPGTRKKGVPSELKRSPCPDNMRWSLRLALLGCLLLQCRAAMDECYDETSRAQRCMPEFVNAAFNVTVVASNTCGSPPEEYCVQTGVTGVTKSCHICDSSDPRLHHDAVYLTDYNNQADTTWWQSQTMLSGIQYPNSISLTLHLELRTVPFKGVGYTFKQSVGRCVGNVWKTYCMVWCGFHSDNSDH